MIATNVGNPSQHLESDPGVDFPEFVVNEVGSFFEFHDLGVGVIYEFTSR